MIDINKARNELDTASEEHASRPGSAYDTCHRVARAALDELEASRKPSPMAALFDVVAAREERARIDADWEGGDRASEWTAFESMRALLDRALDALAAGWEPAGDVVERAAIAACKANPLDEPTNYRAIARAVLASAGRLPAPVEITDAMVEEAAILSWLTGDESETRESWTTASEGMRNGYRHEARAVLEYAASRGVAQPVAETSRRYTPSPAMTNAMPLLSVCVSAGLTEAQTIEWLAAALESSQRQRSAPVDTGIADRLTRYRCAAVIAFGADHGVDEIEGHAHAMLAAERPVS